MPASTWAVKFFSSTQWILFYCRKTNKIHLNNQFFYKKKQHLNDSVTRKNEDKNRILTHTPFQYLLDDYYRNQNCIRLTVVIKIWGRFTSQDSPLQEEGLGSCRERILQGISYPRKLAAPQFKHSSPSTVGDNPGLCHCFSSATTPYRVWRSIKWTRGL